MKLLHPDLMNHESVDEKDTCNDSFSHKKSPRLKETINLKWIIAYPFPEVGQSIHVLPDTFMTYLLAFTTSDSVQGHCHVLYVTLCS